MKRVSVLLVLSLLLLLTACSETSSKMKVEVGNKRESASAHKTVEKKPLTLQVTKTDASKGVTIENNQFYQSVNKMLKKNPTLGSDNRFGLYSLDIYSTQTGQKMFIFLAVNRIHKPIKNVSFDFTLGTKDGEYIWKKFKLQITEDKIGVFQPQSAIPVQLPLTEEQYALANSINKENYVMKLENLKFETAK